VFGGKLARNKGIPLRAPALAREARYALRGSALRYACRPRRENPLSIEPQLRVGLHDAEEAKTASGKGCSSSLTSPLASVTSHGMSVHRSMLRHECQCTAAQPTSLRKGCCLCAAFSACGLLAATVKAQMEERPCDRLLPNWPPSRPRNDQAITKPLSEGGPDPSR
jgi:hypothetical protein